MARNLAATSACTEMVNSIEAKTTSVSMASGWNASGSTNAAKKLIATVLLSVARGARISERLAMVMERPKRSMVAFCTVATGHISTLRLLRCNDCRYP